MKCKYCYGEAIRWGTRKSRQKWRCKRCSKHFTYGEKIVKIDRPIIYDYSLGYVIGVLAGDGSLSKYIEKSYYRKGKRSRKVDATLVTKRWRYAFQLAVKDEDFAQAFSEHLENVTGKKTTPFPMTRKVESIAGNPTPNYTFHGFKVMLKSQEWYHKIKPLVDDLNWITKVPHEVKRGFLRGMYDSEGGAYQDDYSRRIHFTSKDYKLIMLVRKLLGDFGITPNEARLRPHDIFHMRFANKRKVDRFYREIGFSIKRKQI